jgi:hypothetical protein
MEQVFEGSTPEEANRKADDFIANAKGIRIIRRGRSLKAGWGSPPQSLEYETYSVTVEYEPE